MESHYHQITQDALARLVAEQRRALRRRRLVWTLVAVTAAALLTLLVSTTHAHEGPEAHGEQISVIATRYTCDPHPDNSMNPGPPPPGMCQVTRWGRNPYNTVGMACPVEWRGQRYYVPDIGRVLECDDTGAYDYLRGLPHIDVRVLRWEQAAGYGLRQIEIYSLIALSPPSDPRRRGRRFDKRRFIR